jgi:hypothetical protein
MGEDSIEEVSGDVKAVPTLEGEPSELLLDVVSLPTLDPALEVVEDLPRG